MSENMPQETSSPQPAKLDVDVRVYPSKEDGNLLAFASVTLGGCFAVKGVKIMEGENGAFVAMPDRKDGKVMELLAARSEKTRPSVREALQNTTRTAEPPAQNRDKAPRQKKADKGER